MKIVVLDGYTENPGDLSWDGIAALGDLTVYDRTAQEDAAARIGEVVSAHVIPRPHASVAECMPELR